MWQECIARQPCSASRRTFATASLLSRTVWLQMRIPTFLRCSYASPWTFIVLKAPRSAVWTLTRWTLIGAKNVSNKSCWNKRNKFYILHFISITSLHERFITYTSDNRQCFSNIHRHTHTQPPMTVTKPPSGLTLQWYQIFTITLKYISVPVQHWSTQYNFH